MFEFEKLDVYTKAKELNREVLKFLGEAKGFNRFETDQLKRASLSVVLNIAEGSSRFTNPTKKNFYMIARGSAFECVAVFDVLKDAEKVSNEVFNAFYKRCEELSKMLFGLIRNLEK